MKDTEAMVIVHNALVGYVEDSAGAGSEEAKILDQAWNKLKESLPDEERFPNGFTCWHETHAEICSMISSTLANFVEYQDDQCEVYDAYENGGSGAMYELAKEWTDEFELANKGREWDGEFMDEVEKFFKSKNESNI